MKKGFRNAPWPDELFARAAKLWREGASAAYIADVTGKSKMAVIGIMRRQGVRQGRKDPARDRRCNPGPRVAIASRPMSQQHLKPKLRPTANPVYLIGNGPAPTSDGKPRKIDMAAIPLAPVSLRLPLVNLAKRQCRWPTHEEAGIHRFCGAGTEAGRSYCPIHERAQAPKGLGQLRNEAAAAGTVATCA
jgi:hypothetical protein